MTALKTFQVQLSTHARIFHKGSNQRKNSSSLIKRRRAGILPNHARMCSAVCYLKHMSANK